MLATVSHDLRTPLTRLRMRLSELENLPAARSAIDDVRQMDDLIENLLALFRPTQASVGDGLRHDAFALVQALVDDLPQAEPEVRLSGAPAPTRCAPAALRRMVDNLVENAVRHGGAHGEVDVAVTAHGGATICVSVCDRGPGLSAEQLATAGTPFLRWAGDDGGRRAGLGLGLYITRALAEREGGRLELSARDGGGLCAALHLPAA